MARLYASDERQTAASLGGFELPVAVPIIQCKRAMFAAASHGLHVGRESHLSSNGRQLVQLKPLHFGSNFTPLRSYFCISTFNSV